MTIRKAEPEHLSTLVGIYREAGAKLSTEAYFNWEDGYPSEALISQDIDAGSMYAAIANAEILGAVCIDENQDPQYQNVPWQFDDARVLVIHRLVAAPLHRGKGYAKMLMDFAEQFAETNNYSSIRLDAFSRNPRLQAFYLKRGYVPRGYVSLIENEAPFVCMEKQIL